MVELVDASVADGTMLGTLGAHNLKMEGNNVEWSATNWNREQHLEKGDRIVPQNQINFKSVYARLIHPTLHMTQS